MIRINLLAVERKVAKKKVVLFQSGQSVTLGCVLVLVAAVAFVGWRYWALGRASVQLDEDIAAAQRETARLQSIITQVRQFEERKVQLQQRVALIEQLRKDQTGPVHMLDQISRALPPALWLTGVKQGATPDEVVIDGQSTTQTGVSDFAANLEASGYFRRSVDIVLTETETITQAPGELVRFSVRALFQVPGAPPPAAAPAAPARRGG
jgi:type IV pilus assembly protein PilN